MYRIGACRRMWSSETPSIAAASRTDRYSTSPGVDRALAAIAVLRIRSVHPVQRQPVLAAHHHVTRPRLSPCASPMRSRPHVGTAGSDAPRSSRSTCSQR